MLTAGRRSASRAGGLVIVAGLAAVVSAGVGLALLSVLVTARPPGVSCPAVASAAPASIVLSPAGGGRRVGATEYGGPGDPGSGSVGASGINLLQHPDSYAELGGDTFQTATAMGGLPYMTPLRVTWESHSAVAYKRDFGLGGGPVVGLPRAIDLWWQFAEALRIPYEDGLWSGAVSVAPLPGSGAGNVLEQSPQPTAYSVPAGPPGAALPGPAGQPMAASLGPAGQLVAVSSGPAECERGSSVGGVPVSSGPRAQLLAGGQATAPADAPAAVLGIIAAGDQIVGKPYLYGGGHGLPLDQVAPAYDCSSSVEHLLYGGGLLPMDYDAASGALESFGLPGPGRWVTIYASADHVFMYVAGLRWDTHNAAGPQDGSTGIGWHPLVRTAAGFVVRHPAGL
jgi:cell wall-associated NlpC family hydrolase